MKFVSTRGGCGAVSFEKAVGSGYAPDGGLFVPESLPPISAEMLRAWRELDYASLAFEVLWPFVEGEIDRDAFKSILAACYAGFEDPAQAVRVTPHGEGVFIAELYRGPTYCFKDLGLQVLLRVLSYFATKRGARATLLVSTTGDTGPAALRAAADVNNPLLRIVCFYPEGMVSELQRKQMTTLGASDSVRVATFEGGGDDMDAPLKRLAMDADFAARHGLCGINSYNVCRPLAQMVHYVWTYVRCCQSLERWNGPSPTETMVLDVLVPTGAMGNLAAATFAKVRGVPLGELCVACNCNDVSHRAVSAGDFSKAPGDMLKTLSDAINIQLPYNFERVLYYAHDRDATRTRCAMAEVEATGGVRLAAEAVAALASRGYRSARVTDDRMLSALRDFREQRGYVADPHTAVALAAGRDSLGYFTNSFESARPARPFVVLATAHPCKFQHAVTHALGHDAWRAFAASAAFPSSAVELLGRAEETPLRFAKRKNEQLEDAQCRWEAVLRAMLEDEDGLSAVLEILEPDDDDDDDDDLVAG